MARARARRRDDRARRQSRRPPLPGVGARRGLPAWSGTRNARAASALFASAAAASGAFGGGLLLRGFGLLLHFGRGELQALDDPEQALVHFAADALALFGRHRFERAVRRHLAEQLAADRRQVDPEVGRIQVRIGIVWRRCAALAARTSAPRTVGTFAAKGTPSAASVAAFASGTTPSAAAFAPRPRPSACADGFPPRPRPSGCMGLAGNGGTISVPARSAASAAAAPGTVPRPPAAGGPGVVREENHRGRRTCRCRGPRRCSAASPLRRARRRRAPRWRLHRSRCGDEAAGPRGPVERRERQVRQERRLPPGALAKGGSRARSTVGVELDCV